MEESFPDRFKRALREKGITFYRLSKKTGVSKSTISNYSLGKITRPDMATLKKICDYLEVSPNWLLHGTGEMRMSEADLQYISYSKHPSVSKHDREIAITTIRDSFKELDWHKERNKVLENIAQRQND